MAFVGKTYIVTGGASGLGEAAVRKIASLGGNVAIFDLDEARGNEIAKELGSKVAFFQMNALDEESIKKAVDDAYSKFGRLDGAVNCAGGGVAELTVDKKLKPHDSKSWDFVVKLNLYGTFNTCKYAAAYIGKNEPDESGLRGVLINCSSGAAIEGQKGQVAYAAGKGAVVAMTLPMARDLGKIGIRVVTICPGVFDTPMMAKAPEPVRKGLVASVVSPSRFGVPHEFGSLVAHIIENKYLNGEVIRLDGALRMGYI